MNHLVRWGFALALLPIAACSSSTPPPAPTPAPMPMLSTQDSGFITSASQGNLGEIAAGQLAAKQASGPRVKAFGQKMVDDHTSVNNQLSTLASSKSATVATGPSDADQANMTKLQAMKGPAFNKEYLAEQIAGHQAMIELLNNEIANGTDADVKAFAQQTLPAVQQHLMMAQRLAGVRVPAAPHAARAMHKAPAKS